jgi:hypothetical protein
MRDEEWDEETEDQPAPLSLDERAALYARYVTGKKVEDVRATLEDIAKNTPGGGDAAQLLIGLDERERVRAAEAAQKERETAEEERRSELDAVKDKIRQEREQAAREAREAALRAEAELDADLSKGVEGDPSEEQLTRYDHLLVQLNGETEALKKEALREQVRRSVTPSSAATRASPVHSTWPRSSLSSKGVANVLACRFLQIFR